MLKTGRKLLNTVVILIGIAGITIPVYLFYINRPKRELTIHLIYNTSLIAVGKEIKEDIIITFRGKEIENINKSAILIKNTGNKEIKNDNILIPITVTIEKNEIIDRKYTNISEDFGAKFEYYRNDKSKLVFYPNYMECGDGVILEILSLGPKTKPIVTGKIVPPRYVCKITGKTEPYGRWIWIPMVISTVCIILIVIITGFYQKFKDLHDLSLKRKTMALFFILLLMLSYYVSIVFTYKDNEAKKAETKIIEKLFEE